MQILMWSQGFLPDGGIHDSTRITRLQGNASASLSELTRNAGTSSSGFQMVLAVADSHGTMIKKQEMFLLKENPSPRGYHDVHA